MKTPSVKRNGCAGVNWIFVFVGRFIQKEDNCSAGSLELPWRQRSQGHVAEGTQGSSEEPQHQEKHNETPRLVLDLLCMGKVNNNPEIILKEEKRDLLVMKGNNQT